MISLYIASLLKVNHTLINYHLVVSKSLLTRTIKIIPEPYPVTQTTALGGGGIFGAPTFETVPPQLSPGLFGALPYNPPSAPFGRGFGGAAIPPNPNRFQSSQGKFRINCQPTGNTGWYQLHITVCGQHIRGSPFRVEV